MAHYRLIAIPLLLALLLVQLSPLQAQSSLADGLVACWDFTEPSGPRADSTTNNNHLTDNNTVGSVAGIQGVAASFVAASTEYLSIPLASAPLLRPGPGGAFTITGWSYRTDTSTGPLYANVGTTTDFTLMYTSGISGWRFRLNLSQPDEINVDIGTPGTSGTWQFVAAWFDGAADVAGMQINAGIVVTQSTASMTLTTNATTAYIGRQSSNYRNGYIDTVTVHNRVLSQSERNELYNSGSGVTCSSLVSSSGGEITDDAYTVDLPSGRTGNIYMSVTAGEFGVMSGLAVLVVLTGFRAIQSMVARGRAK